MGFLLLKRSLKGPSNLPQGALAAPLCMAPILKKCRAVPGSFFKGQQSFFPFKTFLEKRPNYYNERATVGPLWKKNRHVSAIFTAVLPRVEDIHPHDFMVTKLQK